MNIAVVSGKGGAGKTLVATNLFEAIRLETNINVELIDANVESPNSHIFLREHFSNAPVIKKVDKYFPVFDSEKCTYCGRCVHYCEYDAIVMVKELKHIFSQHNICTSCGACSYACNDKAITEVKNEIGEISIYESTNSKFIEGRSSIGNVQIKPLIKSLKQELSNTTISIIDSPSGISSLISEIVYDANFVVIVAEPSVFGLHDLRLVVQSLNMLRKDFGVVVNRYRGEFNDIHEYLNENDIPLLMNIPYSEKFAQDIAKAKLIVDEEPNLRKDFYNLFEEVKRIYIQKSMYR